MMSCSKALTLGPMIVALGETFLCALVSCIETGNLIWAAIGIRIVAKVLNDIVGVVINRGKSSLINSEPASISAANFCGNTRFTWYGWIGNGNHAFGSSPRAIKASDQCAISSGNCAATQLG